MLGDGWLTLRQAGEALQSGRLEEAHRLLRQPASLGRKGASGLLRELAQAYLKRGESRLRHGDLKAAWEDVVQAERTGACGEEASRLRQALSRRALDEVRQLLNAGEPGRATETLGRLAHGSHAAAEVQLLDEAARGWGMARDLAARGELSVALDTVERIRSLVTPVPPALEQYRSELLRRRPALTGLVVQLHEAWAAERWPEVVRVAEQVLGVAPQHAEARKARARAWKAIESAGKEERSVAVEASDRHRFLIWVDGVGGFLVCLGHRVTLGQAAPEGGADVPLLADVSRTHAAVTRDAEGYLLEAVRSVLVNDRPADRALLQPGDRITLGSSCQLRFRQPVPVSASARLDVESGHRLPLRVDGVLLMADTLVLGPGVQAHVTIPDLPQPIVLYRQKDGLGVRHAGQFTVDGQACRERGTIGPASRVRGDDFAFAVEPVGARM